MVHSREPAEASLSPAAAEVAALIRTADLGPDASRLAVRLTRLVGRGRPVTDDQVADAIDELGIHPDQARKHLDAYAERNTRGEVIGVAPGLTLRQTPHRFTTDTAQMYAWCAMDTLIIPAVLGQQARVATTAPTSEQTNRFTATPHGVRDVEPAGVVVSFPGLVPGPNPTDPRRLVIDPAQITSVEQIWAAFCQYSFVFGSLPEAREWFVGRDDVVFLPLSEAFDVLRAETENLLAYE